MRIIDNLGYEKQEYESSVSTENKPNKVKTNVLIFSIFIVLWLGTVYFGYTYAKNYLDASIDNVRQENAMNIKEIKENITLLSNETRNLRASMEDAGMVISSTSDVQTRIDEKLLNLESQLKDLEKSLEILQEAPQDAEN
ncbi:MAG: hypothetical protein ABFD79_18010 [Phycisphaerales bacterium]